MRVLDGTLTVCVVLAVIATTFTVGAYTFASLHDTEETDVSVHAAGDFDDAAAQVRPPQVGVDPSCENTSGRRCETEGVVTVFVSHPSSELVNSDRFRVHTGGSTIIPVRASCRGGGRWDCRVTVSRADLQAAVDYEWGSHRAVVVGETTSGQIFDAVFQFDVVPGDSGPSGTRTATPTTTVTWAGTTAEKTPTDTATPDDSDERSRLSRPHRPPFQPPRYLEPGGRP